MSRISSPRFVGRTQELARLQAALASGEPRTLLLGGEAGIGKTRLLAEFSARARQAGARVLTGACLDVGEGTLAYAPISQALRQLVRELDPATLEQVLGGWRAELARLVPELGPADLIDQAAAGPARGRLLAGLLGWWSGWPPSGRWCWPWRTCTGPTVPPWTCWRFWWPT